MKKLIGVVLVLLFIAGCTDMTASLWDERDNAVGARIGYVFADADEPNDPGQLEAGLSVVYWPDGENTDVFGAFGMYKWPDMVEIPNPLPLVFLPEILMGTPYLGGTVDSDGNNSILMAGIEIHNTLFMEYQDNIVFVGLKRRF